MADTHSPLQQLADISEPAWQASMALPPIAWLALVALCTALLYLVWRQYRRWHFFAAKRHALALLTKLADQPDGAAQINQLLKRVLQHYQKAHPALSLPITQWQSWLLATHNATLPDLSLLLYSATPDYAASRQFYLFAEGWLRRYNGNAPIGGASAEHTTGGKHD
ncbi:DUF4381 domain-containing protein [Rheinheimera gaetbuli]